MSDTRQTGKCRRGTGPGGGEPVETHGYRLKRSKKHPNRLITRVPVSYLTWMVREGHSEVEHAKAELARRGTVLPSVEISHHGIDRASLLLWKGFQNDHAENEGLSAWLHGRAVEALEHGRKHGTEPGRIRHAGIEFYFDLGETETWPLLKTVTPTRDKRKRT